MAKSTKSSPAIGLQPNQRVEVRSIQNGYIVTKSGVDSKGNYKSTEMFSKTNPIRASTK